MVTRIIRSQAPLMGVSRCIAYYPPSFDTGMNCIMMVRVIHLDGNCTRSAVICVLGLTI